MSIVRSDYNMVLYFDGIDPEGSGGIIPQLVIDIVV